MKNRTVTSIVHHHVKEGKIQEFEIWLKSILAKIQKFEGFLGHRIVDECGAPNERITIFRFANRETLNVWLSSEVRAEMLGQLKEIVIGKTEVQSYTGLEFWFDRLPQSRIRMSALTYIGLLPLVLLVPRIVELLFPFSGIWLTIVSTAASVLLMTYVMMPTVMKVVVFFSRRKGASS